MNNPIPTIVCNRIDNVNKNTAVLAVLLIINDTTNFFITPVIINVTGINNTKNTLSSMPSKILKNSKTKIINRI